MLNCETAQQPKLLAPSMGFSAFLPDSHLGKVWGAHLSDWFLVCHPVDRFNINTKICSQTPY